MTVSLSFAPPVTGVPVNSRVSSKIQQLLNTLKKPKRPPLKEFFVDDFEELLEGKWLVTSSICAGVGMCLSPWLGALHKVQVIFSVPAVVALCASLIRHILTAK